MLVVHKPTALLDDKATVKVLKAFKGRLEVKGIGGRSELRESKEHRG